MYEGNWRDGMKDGYGIENFALFASDSDEEEMKEKQPSNRDMISNRSKKEVLLREAHFYGFFKYSKRVSIPYD